MDWVFFWASYASITSRVSLREGMAKTMLALLMISAKTSSGESSGVQSQEESSEPEPDTLLAASFGKLYKGQTYYIETDMKVESISSSGSSSHYHMTIAIDKSAAQGMLSMTIENGSENHIIIRDGQSYNLNDTLKTYEIDFRLLEDKSGEY